MKIDGVFAGGGVRAFAFVGALEVMEKKGLEFEAVCGTSAGALFCSLLKAGYKSKEIEAIISEIRAEDFIEVPKLPLKWLRWVHLYFRLGLYKSNKLEAWISEKLEKKGLKTFGDLPEGTLKIIASDISRGRILVLPDDLPDYGMDPKKFSIAKAVKMSSSIPYFFQPSYLTDINGEKSVIVDGGVLSNFPLWLFLEKYKRNGKRPVIGFKLTPNIDEIPPYKITNALEMFHSLFETMRKAHDVRFIVEEHAKNIVFIPVDEVKATNFDISEKEKKALIQVGRERGEKFLKKWTY